MDKINFLFELGTEEIPASYIKNAIDKIEESFKKDLVEFKLNYITIELFSTPRRLSIKVLGLDDCQADEEIEKSGPAKRVAYDEAGNLTKAGQGFLRGANAKEEDIYILSSAKGEYIAIKQFVKGKATKELLSVMMKNAIERIVFPKTMKWGLTKFMFARPIRWILALYNNEILDFEYNNIKSSNVSYGIRFDKKYDYIDFTNVFDYPERLKEVKVIADRDERKDLIKKQINALSNSEIKVLPDERLMEIVTDLVEFPTAVMASFPEEYLFLPPKIITSTLTQNQKYFCVLDKNNNLTNKFVFISNGNPEYSEIIKQGNEKVVRARLEDAKFYYNEDTKRPLKAYVDKLDNVVFQAKLGTLSEKTQRVNLICTYISEKIKLNKEETLKISEATILSKADLVTLMLGEKEFTKLQGYIGMYYALQSGIENDIATAIYEHYMPRGQNDDLPSNIIGAVLSIADKFDTLCGIIGVDLIPTGSNDPFALRRAANGIVQIIDKYKFDLSLNDLVEFCFKILESKLQKAKHNIEIVKDFVKQRIKWLLEINNIDFDVINALDIFEWDNIVEIKNRAKDLQKFKTLPQFITLVSGYKRVSNILEKNQFEGDFDYTLLVETNEKILTDSLINLEKEVKPLLEKMQYHLIMEKIVPLGAEIDAFFDKVLVMCDDEKLKNNRLALLNKIKTLFLQVADISKINYENQ